MALGQDIGVHYARRIVQSWLAHHRTVHVPAMEIKLIHDHLCVRGKTIFSPVDVVGNQGHVQEQGEPLSGEQEQQIEEYVEDVFRKNELAMGSKNVSG